MQKWRKSSFIEVIKMCEFCEDKIYKNNDGEFFLEVETNHWDYYYDGYEKVELWGIEYCPYCGRKLGDEYETE